MSDPGADMAAKIAVNLITEVFKKSFDGLREANDWLKAKRKEHDPFGRAAKSYADKLEERYNSMRIFGMNKPVPLRNIFTRVNILEKITARHYSTVSDLERFFNRDLKSFGELKESSEGLEVVNKLKKVIVLGKPGAGKTTFLKHIVLQALDGKLAEKRIPVFIGLKDWSDSEDSLLEFIIKQFDICGFPDAGPFVERVLSNGDCLLLLDGFDEVSHDVDKAITQIQNLVSKYSENQFILSCRIAAYNYCFEQFTDVEIADFNNIQIETFINNWFGIGTPKSKLCWEKIKENKSIRELATIPLLLTMLCLAFDETLDFPANKSELYKEALDALFKKWDASRCIKREEIYRHLSLRRKESMFSRIAAATFQNGQYFVPQRMLEKQIAAYIQNLPETKEDTLIPDSESILRAIEAQHGLFVERAKGIYSFSHLTFQEYFTARYIVDNERGGTVERLVKAHLLDHKWREVFLLTAEMLDEGDRFFTLIQNQVDALCTDSIKIYLKSIQEEVSRRYSSADVGRKAFLIYYTLIVYPFGIFPEKDFALHIIKIVDKNLAHDLRTNPSDVLNRAFNQQQTMERVKGYNKDIIPVLSNYLKATCLLLDCLNTECYISSEVRQRIYNGLLTTD